MSFFFNFVDLNFVLCFNSSGQSPGRAIVLPSASVLALALAAAASANCLSFMLKVFM